MAQGRQRLRAYVAVWSRKQHRSGGVKQARRLQLSQWVSESRIPVLQACHEEQNG